MSTFRTLLLVIPLLSLTGTNVYHKIQGGTGPAKLYGPQVIATSKSKSAMKAVTDDTYTYTVELNQSSNFDTTLYVTDETASAQPTVYTIVVPAHQTTADFHVVAAFPGDDTIEVYNANGSVYKDVIVL
jgi:hypothetical protein